MRCGHGWEQSYEIEHHTDADGHRFVRYVAGGRVVPSPLSQPACQNCDSHVVRIMRAGQVASVRDAAHHHEFPHHTPQAGPVEVPQPQAAGAIGEAAGEAAVVEHGHHWHLADLLHVFQRRAS
jgi:hypothetical protein